MVTKEAWAKVLAEGFGGFASTGFWHRFFALIVFGCFAVYMILLVKMLLAGRKRGVPFMKLVFGPDSPMPGWREFKDFFAMVRWLLGLGPLMVTVLLGRNLVLTGLGLGLVARTLRASAGRGASGRTAGDALRLRLRSFGRA